MSKGITDYQYKKNALILEQGYKCPSCGESLIGAGKIDLSHRIPRTKANIKLYGLQVIDHIFNLAATHANGYEGRACNDAVMISRASQPIKAKKLIDRIKKDLELC